MSMLQAQVDELRELAGDGSMEFVSGPVRASVLREAANTIWELRGSVHRERAEADRLREELAIRKASEQEKAIEYLRQENIDWEDKYRALAADNAKLRELVADVHEALCADKAGMFHKLILANMEDDMRELGVDA